MKPFTSRYDTLRNEEEFVKFTEIFAKVLKRRGIERKKYIRDLEDYFCYVRVSDQTRAKDQLKELFGRIKELKKENLSWAASNHELYKQGQEQQVIIDSLRAEMQELLTATEADEVLIRKGHCNQDTKPLVQL